MQLNSARSRIDKSGGAVFSLTGVKQRTSCACLLVWLVPSVLAIMIQSSELSRALIHSSAADRYRAGLDLASGFSCPAGGCFTSNLRSRCSSWARSSSRCKKRRRQGQYELGRANTPFYATSQTPQDPCVVGSLHELPQLRYGDHQLCTMTVHGQPQLLLF